MTSIAPTTNSTRRAAATAALSAALLAAALAPQAPAKGVDLRSPDARDSGVVRQAQGVDLRSADARDAAVARPTAQSVPAPAGSSPLPGWLIPSIGAFALVLAAATITTTRRRRRRPAVAVRG